LNFFEEHSLDKVKGKNHTYKKEGAYPKVQCKHNHTAGSVGTVGEPMVGVTQTKKKKDEGDEIKYPFSAKT